MSQPAQSHESHYDLVVIGAGPAGEKGAAQAAYFGKRVCVIERAPKPGGAAVNTGTIPSKTLREAALALFQLRQRGLYGVDVTVRRDIAIGDFMARERSAIEQAWTLIEENFSQHGIAVDQGTARFIDPHTVEVTRYGEPPRLIQGDSFLIATGASPTAPPGLATDGQVVVDSESLLRLDRIPESLVVVGGGAVGCEYACTFAALGTRVTIVTSKPRLLAHVDHEAAGRLREQMTARFGIQVIADREIADLTVREDRAHLVLSDGAALDSDGVLWAAGRVGNTEGLGLDAIGIHPNAQGFLPVDANFRTAVPHIFAAGDVIGFPALASVAMEQARLAVCHAFDLRYKQQLASALPYGIWTIPEVATVGETEEAVAARDASVEVGRSSYRHRARGQITGQLDGFLKLVFRPEDLRLLGVTIVGESACELIHLGASTIASGGTIDVFIQACYNHPTLGDLYKYAAYDGLQRIARRAARMQGLPSVTPRSVPAS